MSRCSLSHLFVAMVQNQKLTQAKRYEGRARQGRSKTPRALQHDSRTGAVHVAAATPRPQPEETRLDFRVLAGVTFDPSSVQCLRVSAAQYPRYSSSGSAVVVCCVDEKLVSRCGQSCELLFCWAALWQLSTALPASCYPMLLCGRRAAARGRR